MFGLDEDLAEALGFDGFEDFFDFEKPAKEPIIYDDDDDTVTEEDGEQSKQDGDEELPIYDGDVDASEKNETTETESQDITVDFNDGDDKEITPEFRFFSQAGELEIQFTPPEAKVPPMWGALWDEDKQAKLTEE